jgi:hypothetical protein
LLRQLFWVREELEKLVLRMKQCAEDGIVFGLDCSNELLKLLSLIVLVTLS